MIQNCANLDYLLDIDSDYGTKIIDEIFRQRDDKELIELYYFATPNNINSKYETFNDFKKTIVPDTFVKVPVQNLSVDKIMEQVKKTLDLFTEE